MGRYSSVQAYADTNANARTVSYEQARGTSAGIKGGVVKPEKVVNPYGSTAGAGSGEFHVYRHARAREMERLKTLQEEDDEARKDREFREKLLHDQQIEQAKTEKRRNKRKRQKEAKMRKSNLQKVGIQLDGNKNNKDSSDDGEDEFEYTPIYNSHNGKDDDDEEPAEKKVAAVKQSNDEGTNNGSTTRQGDQTATLKAPPLGSSVDEGSSKEMTKSKSEQIMEAILQTVKSSQTDADRGDPKA